MDLLTVEEVAERLRVKKSWVYTHAQDLGGYHLGKYLRFFWPRVLERLNGQSPQLKLPPGNPMVLASGGTEWKENGIKIVD